MKPPPPSRTTTVFVDAVEDDKARLMLGERAFTVPVALLPEGAREGTWLRLSATIVPPPVDPDALRRDLGKDDPGGPLKL